MASHSIYFILALCTSACTISACTDPRQHDNQLTDQERKDGWTLLFDGGSTSGWHLYNKAVTPSAWTVSNGELVCDPVAKAEHGDLVTDSAYKNFDLKFDWKINKGGNSGVFINVNEKPEVPATWASGPEYQLLEPSNRDQKEPKKRTGCVFGFTPAKDPVAPRPFGEWNESEIKQQDGKVEFYLNGLLTDQRDFNSSAWTDSIANTYFKNFPGFGRQTGGPIALQDWTNGVSFKNIKIRTN
jgi:hypothetical protein